MSRGYPVEPERKKRGRAVKIVDIAIGVIANPYSEMVTAGGKGGKAAHDIVFIEIKTDEGLTCHAFAWGGRSGQATAHLENHLICQV